MSRPFDDARYKGLLEGLEVAEIRQSQLNAELRYEAEFFRQRYLKEDSALSHWPKLTIGEFTHVTDGPHGYHVVDEASPIVMLTAKNAKNWFSNREGADPIAEWVDANNKRSSLAEGDIILSTRGTVGMCALVTEEVLPANIDQDVARVSWTDRERFLPEFVVAYLNSTFGQDHIARHASGMVQQGLSLQKVREVPLPLLTHATQAAIATTVRAALQERRKAVNRLNEAEQTLLRTLGLENWQPPHPLTYTRRASDAFAAGRLDAEHFLPKFDDMLRTVRDTGLKIIELGETILPVKNGFDYRQFIEEGTPYIRVGDISQCRIKLESAERVAIRADEVGKDVGLKLGDVLYTRKGSYGNAAHVRPGEEHSIISSEIILIRLKPDWEQALLPEYLAMFFNSMMGRLQAEKWAHGAAFCSISQGDLNIFALPILPIEQQATIKAVLDTGETARRQAHGLLEAAKRAVEIAIEQSEADALTYLKENGVEP